ncbi:hypothetical protein RhiJN_27039 [Ceratobasidium sp. AG-Ba]|nr:hypothetical protein RhiJN_27039 [Ceratobasidium sp. AG-Ba]
MRRFHYDARDVKSLDLFELNQPTPKILDAQGLLSYSKSRPLLPNLKRLTLAKHPHDYYQAIAVGIELFVSSSLLSLENECGDFAHLISLNIRTAEVMLRTIAGTCPFTRSLALLPDASPPADVNPSYGTTGLVTRIRPDGAELGTLAELFHLFGHPQTLRTSVNVLELIPLNDLPKLKWLDVDIEWQTYEVPLPYSDLPALKHLGLFIAIGRNYHAFFPLSAQPPHLYILATRYTSSRRIRT